MAMDEIAGKLGLSRRQAYREYAKGVEAIACLVWDARPLEPPAKAAAAPPLLSRPDTVECSGRGGCAPDQ